MNYDDDKTREEEEKKERELAALIALGVLLYSDQETEILNIIAAHLSADDFDGDLNKWRSAHLAQGRIVEKEVRGVIGSYSQAEREVFNAVIDQSAVNAVRRVDVPLQSAGIPAAAGTSGTASKAAKYFRDQAKHDINTCNTVMRYMSKKGYTAAVNSAFYTAKQSERIWKALGEGALSVAEGRESLQTAVRSTIMNMSRDGIPAFIDKAGREWSPEAYVRMDLRTTAANTARQATFERCAENDINLIEVDAHSGARPLCAPWQGRIYSLDGTSGTVKDGSGREFNYIPLTSTSYGQAAGLFGINCGHRPYPFRPGVNFKTWQPLSSDEDFDRNSKRYKQFQKQRAMERRIRADKRDCMMCNAAGDKQGFTEASQRLKRSREKYAAYCKNTGLKQHNDRTQVYGFDRSVSAKAVWADRKAAEKYLKMPNLSVDKSSEKSYNFNIEKAHSDAKALLSSYPETKCSKIMSEQLDEATFELDLKMGDPFSISRKTGVIHYNPSHEDFYKFDHSVAILHETAHRADIFLYHAAENDEFKQAVFDSVVHTNRDSIVNAYIKSSPEIQRNSYLSDILSAVTENDERINFIASHENEYLLEEGHRESEIFADLFTIESMSETEVIDFLKNTLPDLYASFLSLL